MASASVLARVARVWAACRGQCPAIHVAEAGDYVFSCSNFALTGIRELYEATVAEKATFFGGRKKCIGF